MAISVLLNFPWTDRLEASAVAMKPQAHAKPKCTHIYNFENGYNMHENVNFQVLKQYCSKF